MKKLLLALAIITATSLHARRVLVDTIRARVNGVNITHSMLNQPQITKNGGKMSLDEYINQELWVQRAVERNVVPSDDDVERSIISYKQENNLVGVTDERADEILKSQIGLSFNQYRGQLRRHYAVEQLKSMEMRNRASVSEVEVRTHYETHPVVVPAEYKMDIATLSEAQRHEWPKLRANADTSLEWEQFDWFKHHDVAQHLRGVYKLKKGEIADPVKFGDEYLVIKLVDKKKRYVKTLSEQYAKIEQKLQRKKVDRYAHEMEGELKKDAVIVRL